MERLTKRTKKGTAYLKRGENLSKKDQEITGSREILQAVFDALQRLADYEDIREKSVLVDKNGREICVGHIVRLITDAGDIRHFKVKYKTVEREIINLDGFENGTSKVAITGIVFEWEGHDLFPCIDQNGRYDTEKMEIIGIY